MYPSIALKIRLITHPDMSRGVIYRYTADLEATYRLAEENPEDFVKKVLAFVEKR